MSIQITNTLSGKKETFIPITPNEVKMYVCGPTVYNFIHIGNARPNVFFDVVQRYLEYSGYKVTRVMNFTDVEDKIIQRAKDEKTTWDVITERYIAEFLTDMALLKVRPPTIAPKVSTHIKEIIELIEGLVKNGTAYVAEDGEVFYSVRSFKEYGKLSGKNIDDLISGARVQTDEKKRDPLDFSLWKPQKVSTEAGWDSPWGKGRPGWHIECSAMAMRYLGETFDIHGGGVDLTHPHHENEIAQSEAFTGKQYVHYWMHNNMLTFANEKMSKSVGNILLNREFVKLYSAECLRFLLLSGHYRSTIDFSDKHVKEMQATLQRFYRTLEKATVLSKTATPLQDLPTPEKKTILDFSNGFETLWRAAMDDDFNTAKVIGLVFEYVRLMNTYIDKKGFKVTSSTLQIVNAFLENMKTLSGVLNIFGENPSEYLNELKHLVLVEKNIDESKILDLIKQRTEARKNKDFPLSDKIRDELLAIGIELRDTASETLWDVVFSA